MAASTICRASGGRAETVRTERCAGQDRVEPGLTRVEACIRHEIWAMRAELRMWIGLLIAGIVVIRRRHRRWH
jgi:hypothetical protein